MFPKRHVFKLFFVLKKKKKFLPKKNHYYFEIKEFERNVYQNKAKVLQRPSNLLLWWTGRVEKTITFAKLKFCQITFSLIWLRNKVHDDISW